MFPRRTQCAPPGLKSSLNFRFIDPMLRSVLQTVLFVAAVIAIAVGLFIAWWIAVCAVLCFAAYIGVRRFLAAKGLVRPGDNSAAAHGPVVIEGQYEVEPEAVIDVQAPRPGRIIDGVAERK